MLTCGFASVMVQKYRKIALQVLLKDAVCAGLFRSAALFLTRPWSRRPVEVFRRGFFGLTGLFRRQESFPAVIAAYFGRSR